MSDSARDKEPLRQAIRNAEQVQEVVKALESKLAADPGDAKAWIRSCAVLVQKLLEAQASVEDLIQKLYAAELVEANSQSRQGRALFSATANPRPPR